MNRAQNRIATLLLIAMLLPLAACSSLSIDPPTPEKPTLLVLPIELVREAQSSRYGFAYAYEIVSYDNSVPPYRALFKLPVKHDMTIVDSLPPGNYSVSRLLTIPVGSGDRTYNTRGRAVNYKFSLEAGKITILPYSLRVRTFNAIPGRGMSTTYSTSIRRTTARQREAILAGLEALPGFSAWEMLDEKRVATGTFRTGVRHRKYVVADELTGDWSGIWRPVTVDGEADCREGSLEFDIEGSRLGGEGVDNEGYRYRLSASFIDNGLIRGKLSLDRKRLAKVTGKLYDDGTILGSFDYDSGCIAEWKARKN